MGFEPTTPRDLVNCTHENYKKKREIFFTSQKGDCFPEGGGGHFSGGTVRKLLEVTKLKSKFSLTLG